MVPSIIFRSIINHIFLEGNMYWVKSQPKKFYLERSFLLWEKQLMKCLSVILLIY